MVKTPYAEDMGSIPGQGTKITHAVQCGKKKFFLKKKIKIWQMCRIIIHNSRKIVEINLNIHQ